MRPGTFAVLRLHSPSEVQVVTGDCAAEECDHEDRCPTVTAYMCAECARIAEHVSPYALEEGGYGLVAYPCPTVIAAVGHSHASALLREATR